jgi:beta-lactamase superfamily II metal-dependent hydrolase
MSYTAVRFVQAWPSVVLRDSPSARGKGLTQCLWGDWVGLYPEVIGDWTKVRTRGRDGWLQAKDLTEERPLEINFVDIGQGDGTFIVTPDDEMIIIDAGATDNMHRFLKWRFNLNNKTKAPPISKVIITHPDLDHYDGFSRIFKDSRFEIGEVLHNGIVERNGNDPLGTSIVTQGQKYLTGIAKTRSNRRWRYWQNQKRAFSCHLTQLRQSPNPSWRRSQYFIRRIPDGSISRPTHRLQC